MQIDTAFGRISNLALNQLLKLEYQRTESQKNCQIALSSSKSATESLNSYTIFCFDLQSWLLIENTCRCDFFHLCTLGKIHVIRLEIFSSRKQELLKYFSIFFVFLLLPTLIKYCQYVIYTYIQVLLIIFLIISDYFFSIFFDFFRFFPISSKNFFRHFYFLFNIFQLMKTCFTIQSFFNAIFTRALDLHLSLVYLNFGLSEKLLLNLILLSSVEF